MSDETPPTVTPDEFRDFIEDMLPGASCVFCGAPKLDLVVTPDERRMQEMRHLAGTGHIPVFSFLCERCGFVHSFATRAVLGWLKRRRRNA